MAATELGTTMFDFALDAETGILVQSFSRNVESDQTWIRNNDGEWAAGAVYNLRASYNISGYVTGAALAGVAADSPGSSMTIANTTSGQGVTAGIEICLTNNLDYSNEDFVQSTQTAIQIPLITS